MKYTTGEIAKLCGVSVRTVQYYDTRGILVPSELSEGGRRIYTEEDLKKLKIICFLRELDLPISRIKELWAEENSKEVISLVLKEQERALRTEIAEKQSRCHRLEELRQSLKKTDRFSVEAIADIADIMENRGKLRRMRLLLLAVGAIADLVQIGMLILWIKKGFWIPFVVAMCAALAIEGAVVFFFYYKRSAYICPACHSVFYPSFGQFMLAGHTPSMRKLTCTVCRRRGFCVETIRKET